MIHKENCCCPCCQIPRLEKTIAEQAEQIEWLKKAIERFYGENALPDMERWIKNEQKGPGNEMDT